MKDPPSLELWWTGKAGYVTSYHHVTLTLQGTTLALQAGGNDEIFDRTKVKAECGLLNAEGESGALSASAGARKLWRDKRPSRIWGCAALSPTIRSFRLRWEAPAYARMLPPTLRSFGGTSRRDKSDCAEASDCAKATSDRPSDRSSDRRAGQARLAPRLAQRPSCQSLPSQPHCPG
jgi:hypothetical protein